MAKNVKAKDTDMESNNAEAEKLTWKDLWYESNWLD